MWHGIRWQAAIVALLMLLAIVIISCVQPANTAPAVSESGTPVEEITLSLDNHESDSADGSTLPSEQSTSESIGTGPGLNFSTDRYEPTDANNAALTQPPQIDITTLEKQVHDLVNAERAKQGLSPLTWNLQLNEVARKHSEDMACRGYFSHVTPEGYTLLDRCQQVGYQVSRGVAENIFQCTLARCDWYRNGILWYTEYYTQNEIASLVVNGWMNSPGHRQNILAGYWAAEGIGVGISPDGKVYITENFS